jgi:nucleotide-binding universal stress UspA family protein
VPHGPSQLRHALLAYDGTPKAHEALFVATYVAARWGISLTVLTVQEDEHVGPGTIEDARYYLEVHDIRAAYVELSKDADGSVPGSILGTAEERGCDLILMGGYGMGPMAEAVLGSTVDRILRESQWPVLVCR